MVGQTGPGGPKTIVQGSRGGGDMGGGGGGGKKVRWYMIFKEKAIYENIGGGLGTVPLQQTGTNKWWIMETTYQVGETKKEGESKLSSYLWEIETERGGKRGDG